MKRKVLTICTHDDRIWDRMQPLSKHWTLKRMTHFDEMTPPVGLVWVDKDLPGAPALDDPKWRFALTGAQAVLASPATSDDEGLQAFDAGFVGYLHLYAPLVQLTQAVKVVQQGNLWVGQTLLSRLLRKTTAVLSVQRPVSPSWAEGLTEREKEVAKRAAMGESNHEIAEACGITERTVKAHLSATFEKLGVLDRLQLTLKVHGIR